MERRRTDGGRLSRTRRVGLAFGLLALLAPSLACGGGSSEDEVTEQNYATQSVRWGTSCDVPFEEVSNATFQAGETPCLELMLAGYYTEGTLEAHWFLGDRRAGVGRVEFNTTQAVLQRLTEGRALSRVTFPLDGRLPPSDDYRVVIHRNDREVATYRFRVRP
ncbi:MAG TPA: hypothetical protein RMH99_12835 [Sandaracinaceae bacterium LLY-WYZ-13_1]|nr:hypothetical protein [Sandaracinaceae bacterium LLY-WYZ-13_1]